MEAKHSPIPWKVNYEGPARLGIETGYGDLVAVTTLSTEDGDMDEANAELIVRAVNSHAELVASLRETLRALEAHLDETCRDHNIKHRDSLCPCNQNEVVRARAALAKAEGGAA